MSGCQGPNCTNRWHVVTLSLSLQIATGTLTARREGEDVAPAVKVHRAQGALRTLPNCKLRGLLWYQVAFRSELCPLGQCANDARIIV